VGFNIVSLDESLNLPLAAINQPKLPQVGKYGVFVKDFENNGIPLIVPDTDQCFFIIDEIGKMECLSKSFKDQINRLVGRYPVVATIAQKGPGYIESIKQKVPPDQIFVITQQNRDKMEEIIFEKIISSLPTNPPDN